MNTAPPVRADLLKPKPLRGFTLVELLVGIAIIAILIALLLPAVQSVRESGRVSQCRNNIRQIALGCIAHEQAHGCFPCAGGGYGDTGNPDQGFGQSQLGGWLYSVLPFIEQVALHQLTGGNATATRVGTVVPMYVCPGRGSGLVRVAFGNGTIAPGPWGANPFARTDYGGNREGLIGIPGYGNPRVCLANQVTDGLSNVLLCGERNLDPDRYSRVPPAVTPNPPDRYDCNEQGWTTGCDSESLCRGSSTGTLNFHMPIQDTPGVASVPTAAAGYGNGIAYGSPHRIFNVAMAAGDVRGIDYSIQANVLSELSIRNDGKGTLDQLGD